MGKERAPSCEQSDLKAVVPGCCYLKWLQTACEMKKNPENHIVGFLMNLFANYGGK
jgi:hypothetical protein